MKRALRAGAAALVLAGLLTSGTPARAQLPLERYRPLNVGDRWVYARTGRSQIPGCGNPYVLSGYTTQAVVGDTLVADAPRRLVTCRRVSPSSAVQAESRYHVAVTNTATLDVVQVSSSSACSLEGASTSPNQASPDFHFSSFRQEPGTFSIGGTTYTLDGVRGWKYQSGTSVGGTNNNYKYTFGTDIGFLSYESNSFTSGPGCSNTLNTLVYAEVGGRTYGANPVAGEAPAPGAVALRLTASPVPARTSVALRLDGALRAEVVVLDVTGRQVAASEWTGAPITVDTHGWAAGVYVARAVTEAGPVSVRFVVVR